MEKGSPKDYLTLSGAIDLAEKLRAFWLNERRDFRCRIMPYLGPSERFCGYKMESNAVNGLPPLLSTGEGRKFGKIINVERLRSAEEVA